MKEKIFRLYCYLGKEVFALKGVAVVWHNLNPVKDIYRSVVTRELKRKI